MNHTIEWAFTGFIACYGKVARRGCFYKCSACNECHFSLEGSGSTLPCASCVDTVFQEKKFNELFPDWNKIEVANVR